MSSIKSIHLLISGRVQGVSYRVWMCKEAEKLDVNGWVRNLHSGEVEAAVAGDAARVDQLIEACRRGPMLAKVTNIATAPWDENINPGFHWLETA